MPQQRPSPQTKVLITGASGFIGSALVNFLNLAEENLVCVSRKINPCIKAKQFLVKDINAQTNWQAFLQDIDIVIHLAARVHIMNENDELALEKFRQTNVLATRNLAEQAISAGVKRFIYLSSIKVNGEQTNNGRFCANDTAKPQDPYAVSKYEAEQSLLALKNIEVVIIRPPLVYGQNMKGNLLRLQKLIAKNIPLPLKNINNKRSFVATENLCSFIQCCMFHPKAAGEIFLVSDGHDISSSELIQAIAFALNKKTFLFTFPPALIKFFACILGKKAEFDRLFQSLQIDISKNQQLLEWKPPSQMQDLLKKYLSDRT